MVRKSASVCAYCPSPLPVQVSVNQHLAAFGAEDYDFECFNSFWYFADWINEQEKEGPPPTGVGRYRNIWRLAAEPEAAEALKRRSHDRSARRAMQRYITNTSGYDFRTGHRPVAFALTPGNVADITMAIPLLGAVAKAKRLLADKAFDADSFRNWLKRRKIKVVIPSNRRPTNPIPARSKDLSTPQCHRTHVLQVEKLATHRNPI
jgi:transposase